MMNHAPNELIPDDVAKYLTIPRVELPGKDEFRGTVTPAEIAALKDPRDISVASTFNKIEDQLSWLMRHVPPVYDHLRMLESRHIVADRRWVSFTKLVGWTVLTTFISAVIYKAVGK